MMQGATFSGSPTGQVSVADPGFFAPPFQFDSGAVLSGFSFFEVTLPAGVTAVGTDLMSTNPDGPSFRVVLATGETFVVNTPLGPERGFFGITTVAAIASIRFMTLPGPLRTDGIPLVDNFSFGQAQATSVPEPATVLLPGTGLAGLATRARRRRKAPKT